MNRILGILVAALALTIPSLAAAGAFTDTAENKLVDAVVRGQALGAPATWHIGLTTDLCSDAGNGTEPSGNGYARVAVGASLANWAGTQAAGSTVASSGSGGQTSNNGVVAFPASTGSWGTVQAVRWYDAASAGAAWICINLSASINVAGAGYTLSFPAGTLQFQVDN